MRQLKTVNELDKFYSRWTNNHLDVLPRVAGGGFGNVFFRLRQMKVIYADGEKLCWATSDGMIKLNGKMVRYPYDKTRVGKLFPFFPMLK